jgi:hypothetical protein
MRYRATFIVGAAVGYVFGTRAGRERYEQLKRAGKRLTESTPVQDTAGSMRSKATELVGSAKSTLQDRLGDRIPSLKHEEQDEESGEPPVGAHRANQNQSPV